MNYFFLHINLLIKNFSLSLLLYSFFSPLTELAFDVFKEVVSELIAETIGSYLGVGNRRKDSEDGFGLMEMILNALRKQSLRKKRGCLQIVTVLHSYMQHIVQTRNYKLKLDLNFLYTVLYHSSYNAYFLTLFYFFSLKNSVYKKSLVYCACAK